MKRILFLGLFSSIAFGQTILDADLVSRIGANRNYVKNPDAYLNIANVSGSVTRSTTTPISENGKTEFNITNMAANARVSWSSFNVVPGISGQSCELSIQYRGAALGASLVYRLNGADNSTTPLQSTGSSSSTARIGFTCPISTDTISVDILNGVSALTGTIEVSSVYLGKNRTFVQAPIASSNSSTPLTSSQVGFLVESKSSSIGPISGNPVYGDITSITLPSAGTWDLTAMMTVRINNVTGFGFWDFFIGTSPGNNQTNRIAGETLCDALPPTGANSTCTIAKYRVVIAAPTTYYLKALASTSTGTPQYIGYNFNAEKKN
jgi:hypothetical protein